MVARKPNRKSKAGERAARIALQKASRAVRHAKKRVGVVGSARLAVQTRWVDPTAPVFHDTPVCKIAYEPAMVTGKKPKEIPIRGKDFQKALEFMDEWLAYLMKTFNKAYPKAPSRRRRSPGK